MNNQARSAQTSLRHSRPLLLTWKEAWIAVKNAGGKKPQPENETGLRLQMSLAAQELGWVVEFIDTKGIRLDDGDSEHFFERYSLQQNISLAISFLRKELYYTSLICHDVHDQWSEVGIIALSEWQR